MYILYILIILVNNFSSLLLSSLFHSHSSSDFWWATGRSVQERDCDTKGVCCICPWSFIADLSHSHTSMPMFSTVQRMHSSSVSQIVDSSSVSQIVENTSIAPPTIPKSVRRVYIYICTDITYMYNDINPQQCPQVTKTPINHQNVHKSTQKPFQEPIVTIKDLQ